MAYPSNLLTDDEEVLADFHAHWRVLLPAIFTSLAVVVAATVVSWLDDRYDWSLGGSTITLVTVVLIVAVCVGPLIRWWTSQYVLTTERIIERHGLIARSSVEIPLENINNVLCNQSAVERVLGYGDVVVESAGMQGQTQLSDIPKPQQFQSQIYRAREERSMDLQSGGRRDTGAVGQLERLAALHDAGKLTDDEFAAQKRALLDGDA